MADLYETDDPAGAKAAVARVVADIGGTAARVEALGRQVEAGKKMSRAVNWYFTQRTAEALDELREAARAFDRAGKAGGTPLGLDAADGPMGGGPW